jgi:capsid protein
MIPFLKNMDDYAEAVIVGARVAACFAAFISTSNPNAAQKSMQTAVEPGDTRPPHTRLQPGTIMYLRPNEIASFASPNKPSDNHDAFVLRSYKTISMAFRIPYILAFLDTEQVSYSSWRGAVLDSFKLVQRWRRDLTDITLWIVNTLILEGMADGKIRGGLSTASMKVRWPSIGILDPEKEARSAKIDIDNKVKSRQMICDERGVDYEDVLREREEEELLEIELQAKILKLKKDKETSLGIIFPDTIQPADSAADVNGESDQPDPEAAKEKRKADGNW